MDPQPASSNSVPFQPFGETDAVQPKDPRIVIPGDVLQPDPPETAIFDDIADAEVEPASAEPGHANEAGGSKWTLAFIASLLFHAAVAAMLILAPESILPPRQMTDIKGAKTANPLLFGNDEADATTAAQQPEVTDVTVVPESELLPPRQAQPAPSPPVQPVQPPEERTQPTKGQEQQPAEPSPDVLVNPQATEEKDGIATLEGRPTAKLEILRPVMPEPSEAERRLAEQQQPAPETPAGEPQPVQSATDPGDQAEADTLRGTNEGQVDGDSTVSGIDTNEMEAGNAVASNYRGLVQKKLSRASRRVSRSAQAKATDNAIVSFVTTANGGVMDVRLVRSSGSSELDKFAVALVKSVAPYPAIPPETGRKTWPFTVQVGPFL
ncbi:energy transducer TonB [Mesorhizobium sp. NPDC059054]|uniref:energy transducer TonB family protein n=1 Tax=Mesorhizobium sp. NPDC059054 TaxID=3346711 RepID=UPI00367970D3